MAILDPKNLLAEAQERASFRTANVSSKLNRLELKRLDALAKERGCLRGELIRELILRELDRSSTTSQPPVNLTEIVGLRLMLTTLLKPLAIGQRMTEETFDAVMVEVNRAKVPVAASLIEPEEGGR
jgi:hypothetical protein